MDFDPADEFSLYVNIIAPILSVFGFVIRENEQFFE
jgi:hypothetical protein